MDSVTQKHLPTTRLAFVLMLLGALTLSACSSIPLSTSWKYRNFGFQEFIQIQAENVRARVKSSENLIINGTTLGFTIEFSGTRNEYKIPMEKTLQKQLTESDWFSERKIEYSEWRVSDSGIKDFKRLQEDWRNTYSQWQGSNGQLHVPKGFSFSKSTSTQFAQDSVFKDGYFSLWVKTTDDYELFIDKESTNNIYEDLNK